MAFRKVVRKRGGGGACVVGFVVCVCACVFVVVVDVGGMLAAAAPSCVACRVYGAIGLVERMHVELLVGLVGFQR